MDYIEETEETSEQQDSAVSLKQEENAEDSTSENLQGSSELPEGSSDQQFMMMNQDAPEAQADDAEGNVVLVDENNQVVGLPPGQQIVQTADGQQVLMMEDGSHQIITSSAGEGETPVSTTDPVDSVPSADSTAATGEQMQQVTDLQEGQQIVQTENGQQVLVMADGTQQLLTTTADGTLVATNTAAVDSTPDLTASTSQPTDTITTGSGEDGQLQVTGLQPGQQIVQTEDGQHMLVMEDGTQQLLSTTAAAPDGDASVADGSGQIMGLGDGQQLIAAPGQQLMTEDGTLLTQAEDGTLIPASTDQTQLDGTDNAAATQQPVYQTADGQILTQAEAQQLMEGQQLLTADGSQALAPDGQLIGQTDTGQQIVMQNGQPTILATGAPDITQQPIVAQMADGQPIYAYAGGDGSGLTPEGYQIIGQTSDGQIIAQLPDGQHIIVPGDQMLLQQQQQTVQDAIKKESDQQLEGLGDLGGGGTSILKQRDDSGVPQPLFRTVSAKSRTATSLSTPLGSGGKSRMESLLNQPPPIRPTSSSGGKHTIQIPIGGAMSGTQTIELPTSSGTKTIQLPMNKLMEMFKGQGGSGKTITLVKTPDGRTVTYVLSTPQAAQGATPIGGRGRLGRPITSDVNMDDISIPPPPPQRVECEADRLQRQREAEERLRVCEEAARAKEIEMEAYRQRQDTEQALLDQKQAEADSVGGRSVINSESGELEIEIPPENDPYDDVPIIIHDIPEWESLVPELSDVESDDGFDAYTAGLSPYAPVYGASSTPMFMNRGRGRPRGAGRGAKLVTGTSRAGIRMLKVNGNKVISMSKENLGSDRVVAGEIGGKRVIAMKGKGGDGARMISVVKTKDGIIRKVLSGGTIKDVKKLIGQAVRVKTPQSSAGRLMNSVRTEDMSQDDSFGGFDGIPASTPMSRRGTGRKISSVNNIRERVQEEYSGSDSMRMLTIKREDDRHRQLDDRLTKERRETLSELQRRQLKMECRVTMEKIDAKVPIGPNSIVKVRVSKVAVRPSSTTASARSATAQRATPGTIGTGRKRGRPPKSASSTAISKAQGDVKIRRPLWMQKLEETTGMAVKKASVKPRGTVLDQQDLRGDDPEDPDWHAEDDLEYVDDEDDEDYNIDNDDDFEPVVKKRQKTTYATPQPRPRSTFTPTPKIAITPENFSVCPQCKRVYAAPKHMLAHFQKEHPGIALPDVR